MTELNPDSVAFFKEGAFNKTPVLLSISQAPGGFFRRPYLQENSQQGRLAQLSALL
jgi:hypothetical protein